MMHLLNHVDVRNGDTRRSVTEEDNDTPVPVSLAILCRKDLDFTEQLWTILRGRVISSSYC